MILSSFDKLNPKIFINFLFGFLGYILFYNNASESRETPRRFTQGFTQFNLSRGRNQSIDWFIVFEKEKS